MAPAEGAPQAGGTPETNHARYANRMGMKLENRCWDVLGPLQGDRAGFGRLLEVRSQDGLDGVAKVVAKVPGAKRELLVGDSIAAAQYRNVIPVIDTGEFEDNWVLVMPRADYSLAQYLERLESALPIDEAMQILKDIATALAEINGTIVHRDLKPANVLFHEGVWKLADFGIARYGEASTAASTRRSSFTPAYAAPEQWESIHATSAADVYAFGVVAFELLTGACPFTGSVEDLREQHLKSVAPELTVGTARVRILIEECLYKDPDLRPKPRAVLARLAGAETASEAGGAAKLAEFSQRRARELSQEQARLAEYRDQQARNQLKFDTAASALDVLARRLRAGIEDNAPAASFENIVGNNAPLFRVELGDATLTFDRARPIDNWDEPFRVFAYAHIEVTFGGLRSSWLGRSHSLWFGDPHEPGRFGWYELAFMESPLLNRSPQVEPFARSPYESQTAFQNVVGGMQLAWPVVEVDRAEPDEFLQRWLGWFADAANGTLRAPSTMPERETNDSWRTR